MKTWHWASIILVTVAVLMVVPYVVAGGSEFAGADGQAEEVITKVDPGYEPWFSPLFEPAGEMESALFALQAAVGAAAIAFAFGYWVGRRGGGEQAGQDSSDAAAAGETRLADVPR